MYRKRLSRGSSRKSFRRNAGAKAKNFKATPMRGGFRI